ncbi:MAG TPA: tetratricopeptide repeat protein [Rhizomicrobium sp.]|jgi:cytochrome c-type biogenesis protein CcmH|nr:tetratricopeptide repeat protein [Rhizomicrobium sp.]
MKALLVIGLIVVALLAIGFAALPVWQSKALKGRYLLIGAIALALLGVGGGTYWMLGQPYLAWRSAQGVQTRDVNGLIALLIRRVRQAPDDIQAWIYLGRGYMGAGDAGDAAKAYARAVAIANRTGHPEAGLDAIYGEALVSAQGGQVSDDAAQAFRAALKLDPREPASRFFLGDALAAHGDKTGALALWNGLLAEAPANSPLHQALVDRIAMLTAQSGAAPDPKAMVAMLAARLKENPNDAAGWQRLIRAYVVLGERAEAQDALSTARKTFASQHDVGDALDAEAKQLKLD